MPETLLTGRETRSFPLSGVKVHRADDGDGRLTFSGQAIVYDDLSADMGGWRERIMPGAASRTLDRDPDVRFLLNHNPDRLLARTASGTLKLTEHGGGVEVAADMANVSYARDVAELLDRGDLTQMSFGFWITAHGWAGDVHEVYGIELDGGDVSVVTYPAFPSTSAELRSLAAAEFRGAISSHTTPTSDASWDGPANEARLSSDAGKATLRKAFAWADPDGDPDTKSAYRFIHHEVSADGTVGAANLQACTTGIAVLNGGRGGSSIPDSDRQGVYNHLAKHLRDGDREVPELRAAPGPGIDVYRRRLRLLELECGL